MIDIVVPPADWTEPEKWAWTQIAGGELADFNARDRQDNPESKDLDPGKEDGWGDQRRLRVRFLKTILTQKPFAEASLHPPVPAQPYWVQVYFYLHKMAGWVLGSFVVAGLAGLTQKN